MHVGVIGHQEAWLHHVELVPGLDLCRDQGYYCFVVDAMEGDLLGACRDVVQVVDE